MSNSGPAPAAPVRSRGRLKKLIPLIVVGICSLGAGILVPRYLVGAHKSASESPKAAAKQAFMPFGEVVVNLSEERLTRYLRVKLVLLIDGNHEQEVTEKITKSKAILKSWLIGYLRDKSLKEVSGTAGVNRLRREIHEEFNVLLGGSESDVIQDVLFEEFVIQ
jgi:flagellar basal body-associated protein FliL